MDLGLDRINPNPCSSTFETPYGLECDVLDSQYKGEYLPVLSMVILHVFEVCQMDEKVGKMVNGVKYPKS